MERFLNMTGYEFENFISDVLQKKGFEVEVTNFSNDGGIDIVATYRKPIFSGKYIIQCKNWQGNVGQPEVRDLYGVVMDQRANKGIIITPSGYTPQAYEFAKGKNIELISGDILKSIIDDDIDDISSTIKSEYQDKRYCYLKKLIAEEPNSAKNHIVLIEYMRNQIRAGIENSYREALLDDLIDTINDMISRCFKGTSKAKYKEKSLLLQVEALILRGNLAEATEMLIRMDRFFIGYYRMGSHINMSRIHEGIEGWNYEGLYTWNLYSAFKYIGYSKGADLILSKERNANLSFDKNPFDSYKNAPKGTVLVMPYIRMDVTDKKIEYFDVSLFYEDDVNNKEGLFENLKKKSLEEYEKELDEILELNGLI